MAEATKHPYEGMFLFGTAAATDQEAAIEQVRQLIGRHEGEVIVLKKWDERKLAYEIEGQKRGLYIIAFFRAPGTAVGAIEREVNLSDQILRVMIVRADHLSEQEMAAVEPQPIQQERPQGERGFGGFGGFGGERAERSREERGPRPSRRPEAREESPAPAAGGE